MERVKAISEFIGTHPFIHKLPLDYPPYITCPAMVCGTIISVSLWRVAYYVMIKKQVKEDIAHRTLAITKGLLAVLATILVGNLNENAFDGDYVNTWSQSILLVCSSGFFAHDSLYFALLLICQALDCNAFSVYLLLNEDVLNLAHHVITFTSIMYSILVGKYASLIMFYHWAYESTSVPLHLRYVMRKLKMNRTHPELFTITELSFIVLYTFERFVIGMHFSYHILCISGEIIPFIPKILCVTVNISSAAFYNSVFALFVRRYGDEFEFLKNFFPPV